MRDGMLEVVAGLEPGITNAASERSNAAFVTKIYVNINTLDFEAIV